MHSISEYSALKMAIELAGYYTDLRANERGTMLVCVLKKDLSGRLSGNSFLISRKDDRWYLSTWGDDVIYLVPEEADLSKLCINCLEWL